MSNGSEPQDDCGGDADSVVEIDGDDVEHHYPGLLLTLYELLVVDSFELHPEIDAEVGDDI